MHEEKREFSYVPGLFGDDVLEELRGHGKEYMRLMSYYASAMLEILSRHNILPAESIAFGDSENDIEMLRTAGIGVAMGNATPECLAVADYVTADCDGDGLKKALEHFELI